MGNVDAIWLVVDSKVYDKDSMEFTLKYCLDKKIAVIGFAANTVKAGALVGFVYDYHDLGRQTGEIVAEIANGKNPGEIPIVVPRKVGYAVNKRTAKYLGIDLSSDMISSAEEVFE
jgi:putative ABC transport system substrate-binding protein